VPAADGTFVPLAQFLRADPDPTCEPVATAAPAPPAPVDFADLARDVRVFRAQLADAFDAGLAAEIDAVLAALLERLQ
jgi:hypothetical protein